MYNYDQRTARLEVEPMNGENSASAAPTAPTTKSRAGLIAGIVVAVLLAAAILVVALMQAKRAQELRQTLASLQQEVQARRQAGEAQDRLVADLIGKLDASLNKLGEGVKSLADTDTKIEAEIASLKTDVSAISIRAGLPPAPAAKDGSRAQLSGLNQPELVAQLASLGDRIEKLKTEVILKETKILQEQITDTKGRIGQAEKDVVTLRNTVSEADLPSLKAKTEEVSREVQQAEAEVKALAKAAEAFKGQVSGFFQEVFYNDPWGKYIPAAK